MPQILFQEKQPNIGHDMKLFVFSSNHDEGFDWLIRSYLSVDSSSGGPVWGMGKDLTQ